LHLPALPGAETFARFAAATNGGLEAFVANMTELQKKKDKMRARFRIVLPNDILGDVKSGLIKGKSISWAFERSQQKDDEAFAQSLATSVSAACDAAGLTFEPKTPLRMNLTSFAELTGASMVG